MHCTRMYIEIILLIRLGETGIVVKANICMVLKAETENNSST